MIEFLERHPPEEVAARFRRDYFGGLGLHFFRPLFRMAERNGSQVQKELAVGLLRTALQSAWIDEPINFVSMGNGEEFVDLTRRRFINRRQWQLMRETGKTIGFGYEDWD